jgi:hypothetical protein
MSATSSIFPSAVLLGLGAGVGVQALSVARTAAQEVQRRGWKGFRWRRMAQTYGDAMACKGYREQPE